MIIHFVYSHLNQYGFLIIHLIIRNNWSKYEHSFNHQKQLIQIWMIIHFVYSYLNQYGSDKPNKRSLIDWRFHTYTSIHTYSVRTLKETYDFATNASWLLYFLIILLCFRSLFYDCETMKVFESLFYVMEQRSKNTNKPIKFSSEYMSTRSHINYYIINPWVIIIIIVLINGHVISSITSNHLILTVTERTLYY